MKKCECGKKAVGTALFPFNIYAGINNIKEKVFVCECHKRKCEEQGIEVI